MELNLNLDMKPKAVEEGNGKLSYEEAKDQLLKLGFKNTPAAKRQSDAFKGKYEWREGHVIRELAFYHTQYHGTPFGEIQKHPEQIFAVYVFYTREGESFETLEAIHKPTPNALTIIHDHPIDRFCIPASRCKELPWSP